MPFTVRVASPVLLTALLLVLLLLLLALLPVLPVLLLASGSFLADIGACGLGDTTSTFGAPINEAMDCAITRPSPVDFCCESSPKEEYFEKSVSAISGCMPLPVSATSTRRVRMPEVGVLSS
jgi:hypothetical protein